MTKRFAGRRALVTGASRGIGAAVAEALAVDGADVAIVARTLDTHPTLPGSLNETASRLRAHGAKVSVVVADMADEADRARIVQEATDGLGGGIDILINNAAMAMYQPNADYPLRRRRKTFEVNFHGPIDLVQAVLPYMLDRGEGWIVNLSSASARPTDGPPFEGRPIAAQIGVYGASKAALNRLTNAFAVELWDTGVRINTIEPRIAVLSEGAELVVGDMLTDDMIEPMEKMVEATLLLCDCPEEMTGGTYVSLDLLEQRR